MLPRPRFYAMPGARDTSTYEMNRLEPTPRLEFMAIARRPTPAETKVWQFGIPSPKGGVPRRLLPARQQMSSEARRRPQRGRREVACRSPCCGDSSPHRGGSPRAQEGPGCGEGTRPPTVGGGRLGFRSTERPADRSTTLGRNCSKRPASVTLACTTPATRRQRCSWSLGCRPEPAWRLWAGPKWP